MSMNDDANDDIIFDGEGAQEDGDKLKASFCHKNRKEKSRGGEWFPDSFDRKNAFSEATTATPDANM